LKLHQKVSRILFWGFGKRQIEQEKRKVWKNQSYYWQYYEKDWNWKGLERK